jgi:hypothetical protein
MTEKKWTMDRIRNEIYDARTKVFVINKVLEAGNLKFADHPEWALAIAPLAKDLLENATQLHGFVEEEKKD